MIKHSWKRLLSMLLVVCMVVSMLPVSALAAYNKEIKDGTATVLELLTAVGYESKTGRTYTYTYPDGTSFTANASGTLADKKESDTLTGLKPGTYTISYNYWGTTYSETLNLSVYHNVTVNWHSDTAITASGTKIGGYTLSGTGKIYYGNSATITVDDVDGYKAEIYAGTALVATLNDENGWTYSPAISTSVDYTVKYVSTAVAEYELEVNCVNADGSTPAWGSATLGKYTGAAGDKVALTVTPNADTNSEKYSYTVSVSGNGSYDASTKMVTVDSAKTTVTVTFSKTAIEKNSTIGRVKFNPKKSVNEQLDALKQYIFAAVVNSGASLPAGITWQDLDYQYYPYAQGKIGFSFEGFREEDKRNLETAAPNDTWTDSLGGQGLRYFDFGQRFASNTPADDENPAIEKVVLTGKAGTAWAGLYVEAEITLVEGRQTVTITNNPVADVTVTNSEDPILAAAQAATTVSSGNVTVTPVWEKVSGTLPTYTSPTATYEYKVSVAETAENLAAEHTVTVNVVLKQYTISWDTDADGEVDTTTKAYYGQTPTAPAAEEKEGYSASWEGLVPATEDTTYTVSYSLDTIYKVSYVTNIDGYNIPADGYNVTKTPNIQTVAPDVEDQPYKIFDAWYTDAALTQKYTFGSTPTGDITLYAKWIDDSNDNNVLDEDETITVNITGNGTVTIDGTTVTNGESVVYNSKETYHIVTAMPEDVDGSNGSAEYVKIAVAGTVDLTASGSFASYKLTNESVALSNGMEVKVEFGVLTIAGTSGNEVNYNPYKAARALNIGDNYYSYSEDLEVLIEKGILGSDLSDHSIEIYVDTYSNYRPLYSLTISALNLGTEKIRVTKTGNERYPEIKAEFTVKLVDERTKTSVDANDVSIILEDNLPATLEAAVSGGFTVSPAGTAVKYSSNGAYSVPADGQSYTGTYTVTIQETVDLQGSSDTANLYVKNFADNNDNDVDDEGEAHYTVTFNGYNAEHAKFEYVLVDTKTPVPATAPTREYYTFVGWTDGTNSYEIGEGKYADYAELSAAMQAVTVTGDVTYTALWKITNDANENNVPDEEDIFTVKFVDIVNGEEVVLHTVDGLALNAAVTEHIPTAGQTPTGVYYAGWDPAFKGTVSAADAAKGTCVITYKVKWNEQCLVTFIYADGETADLEVYVTPGEKVSAPAEPSWEKHLFQGWYLDGVKYDFDTKVEDSIKLTAVWEDDDDGDGEIDGSEADPYWTIKIENTDGSFTELTEVLNGESYDEPEKIDKVDYVFCGWVRTVDSVKHVVTFAAVWTAEVNDNNVLDENETATVVVTVTNNNGASGTVTIGNCHIAETVTNENVTTYTVIYNSKAENGNVISVTATPTATSATEVEYYATAPASVTVADGQTSNVSVTFDAHTLNGSNNGTISGNGSTPALKKEAVTKLAVLKAILGEDVVNADDFNADEYTIKMYVYLIGTVDGYYDIWALNSLGDTLSNMIWEKAVDIPGTESFEITWNKSGYPTVSGRYTVTMTDARPVATATHNGETYNASALDEALRAEIEADITVPEGVIYSVKWGDNNPTELVEGETYTVYVTVTLAENNDYQGNTQTFELTVSVPLTKASITISETADMTYNTGMTDANKVQMVLDAVDPVYVPEALKDVEVVVWYKANTARKVPLTINFAAMDLGVYGYLLPDSTTIEISVQDNWLNIGDDFPETQAPTNEQLEEILLPLIEKHGADFLSGNMTEEDLYDILTLTLKANPELEFYYDYLGAHKFGENELTDANGNVLETVYITQKDTGYGALKSNEAVLTLADLRTETSIKLNTGVAVTYGGYETEELLAALVEGVYDANGNRIGGAELVEFVTDASNLSASEATDITVKYDGDINYKSSTATATIVVNKAAVEVNIDNQVVKYGTNYNKLPVITNPANVDTIQFIVGLDISNVNIDSSEGATLGAIEGIVGSVQLLLPEELQSLLKMADDALASAGLNISFADGASMKLSDLQKAVDALDDIFNGSEYEEYFKVLLNMVKSLPTETADIMITIGGELPTNVGAYLIGAVTADSNYETAFGIGVLAIYPDGIRAELDWKMDDDNYIITRSLLTSGVFDASAVAVSVGEGGTLEEATAQAYELFLGVDIDGNITFESDQTKLNVGAYLEVAMIVNWGNEMYYSAPIARPIVVVAETLDVDFIDVNGQINNERKFVFDNNNVDDMEGKDKLLVTYKQDGNGYAAGDKVADELYQVKYYYVGVQTNGMPYASTTAPLHAGAYTVTAIVTIRGADGITHAGQGIGVLAIEPAQSDVYVDNAAIKFDDAEHSVNALVHASSAASTAEKPLTPDTTIISAGVVLDRTSSASGLEAIEGVVNVDLPKWLDDLFVKYDILAAAYTDEGVSVSVFKSYLGKIRDTLTELSIDTASFDEVVSIIDQLPDTTTLTFHSDKTYSNIGAYLVLAVVTDSDHYPSAGAGMMLIYPDAEKVELKFEEDWNDNNIFTWKALQSINLDAQAYDLGTDNYNAAADEFVTNVYLGFTDDGKVLLTRDKTVLDNGVYTQVAFLLDFGTTMYYAEPISRVFMIVPNPVTITFVDESGEENNERAFTFDNKQHGMDVIVTQNGIELANTLKGITDGLTVTYTGVQNNLEAYNSSTPPTHAGTYAVSAHYATRDEQGRVVNLGVEIGALVILPAESDVYVDNAAYEFDNAEHSVNALVHASSAASTEEKPIVPDTTVISAGVNLNRTSSASGLEAIEGVVNVDLPKWLDDIFVKYNILEAAYTETGISYAVFQSYVTSIRETLTELGVDTASFDEVVAIIDQIPDNTTLTFHSDKTYSNIGAYLILAVVTDSDHYPSVGAGLMLIYPDVTEVELKFEEDWNDNNIFTWQALQTINLDAQAYDLGTDTVNEEANALVTNVYLGFTDDGKVLLTKDKAVLDNGVYTQVAFLLDLGTEMYYAEPISRAFMIVPNPAVITFVDKNGDENDDRLFTFNNREQGMDVIVTLSGEELANTLKGITDGLTVTYTGVQTNLQPYNSTTPPTHAGSYVVTAVYSVRDEQNRLVTLGAEVGAMVIKPADAEITINSAAIPYDGKAHGINGMISVVSEAEGADPNKTVITASVNTNGKFSEDLMKAIEGSINIDLPEWADNVIAEYETIADGITVSGMIAALQNVEAELAELGVDTAVFAQLRSTLEQLPGQLTITFNSNVEKTAVGLYLIIGLVTDSNHMPAMDVGYLVIYPDLVETELEFNNIDANGIFTNDLVESFDFGATAYNAADGSAIDAATELIQHIFFGIDDDGKIVLKAGESAAKTLPYGIYTQLSFIAQIDSVIYLAEPIARPIIRVPNTVNVDFEDVVASYTGHEIGIGTVTVTKLNGDAIALNKDALTVYYAGVSTNGQPYWSETAPVHAGVYTVFAIYVDGENVGAHVGSVTILPAKADISVESEAVKFGNDYDIDVTVIPEDETVDPTDAKYLLITAGTDLSVSGGKLSLSSINTINLDFPGIVDGIVDEVMAKLPLPESITIGQFAELADDIQAVLDLIGYENEYLTQTVALLSQMDESVTVTFEDNFEPTNVGVYFLIASIFDPDYMPAVDTGVLVIYPNGEVVDVEFTTPIPGALNIMPFNTVVDFDFSAYTDKGESFDSLINNVIFGLTTDGELFVGDGNAESYAGNPTELGAYTQVAYINSDLNGLDGLVYVAIPEFRFFTVVKCDYDVIFVEDASADVLKENDDRVFTYDGEAKEMPAVIVDAQGNIVEGYVPTVWYMGVDTTLDPTWSTQAPTEAGIYNTVAYYFDEQANIYTLATGIMVIKKAASEFTLNDTTVSFDGSEKFSSMLELMDNPNNADAVYVIVDREEDVANVLLEDDLSAIKDAINSALGLVDTQLPESAYVDITDFKAAVAEVLADAEALSEKLPESISETVDTVLEKMYDILDKLPADGTVAINSDKPVHVGTYEVYAVSYSANYTPAASAAVLTIEPVEIVITADDASKFVGEDDPELTYIVKADGVVVEASTIPGLTIAISREDGETAGTYDIIVDAQCSDTNYEIVNVVNGTLTINELPEAPTITIADDGTVTITTDEEGGVIYYSTDGGETVNEYTGPFTVTHGTTVTAYVVKDGVSSEEASEKAELQRGYSISGEVISFLKDEEVTVRVLTEDGTEVAKVVVSSGTNESGNKYTGTYTIEGVPAGVYILEVSKADHVTREYEISVTDEAITQDVKIHLIGDINGDGKVTGSDATKALRHIKETVFLTGYEFACADINNDGKVTGSDATKMLRHIKEVVFLWTEDTI